MNRRGTLIIVNTLPDRVRKVVMLVNVAVPLTAASRYKNRTFTVKLRNCWASSSQVPCPWVQEKCSQINAGLVLNENSTCGDEVGSGGMPRSGRGMSTVWDLVG